MTISSADVISQGIYYQTLGNQQGLSQSSAVSFWQDNIGRIWIGNDALNCFDGEDVGVFRVSEHLPGIEDSNVHDLCGNDSVMFFLAENLLACFDFTSETFHNPGISTRTIVYSNERLYYVTTDGIFSYYNWKTDSTSSLMRLPEVAKNAASLMEKEEGIFWIGTPEGVIVVDLHKKEIINTLLEDELIVKLYTDSKGFVWIVTQSHKIFLYSPDGELSPLKIARSNALQEGHFNNSIFCIQEDIKGTFWIGTLAGVYKLLRETDGFHFTLQEHILVESSVYALFSDRQGTIWVGSYYGDVRYYNPVTDNYIYYETNENNPSSLHGALIGQIAKDKEGNMYFATEGSGINILKPGSNSFEHITVADGLPQNKIKDIWYDEEFNRLFISVYMEGICYLDLKSREIHRLTHDTLETIHQRIIERIHPYKNELILHTQNGLFKLDRSTLEVRWFFPEGELRERCSGIIRTIYIDDEDVMWVSSFRSGLFTIDLKTGTIGTQYGDGIMENSKIPSAVIKIEGDRQRGLYFVSLKSGILKYNAATDSFYVFNEEQHQLLSNICYNIDFSKSGKLIVTCNKGISLLDISPDNTVRSYQSVRISPTSPLTAFIGDCGLYVSSEDDNRIYAGGIYGLFCFSEKDLPVSQDHYSLFFTSLNINNEKILPSSSLLNKSFYQVDRLVLPHNRNTFSIKFASSNYLSSRTSQYEYMLDGLDDFWTQISHKTITYNSIRPGKYKLTVRETADKRKKAELDIVVKPPFWATTTAIFLYLFSGLLITWWVIRAYKSRTILQASLEWERREVTRIEEVNRHKMDFFIHISNEFRTPITLILSLIERLPQDFPPGGKSKIEKIKRQVSHLQELITEMLDFRKMEQNKLSLKISKHDLVSFIRGIYINFSDYASEKQVSFKLIQNNEPAPVWFDQRQMQKVFYNLLSFVFNISLPKDVITLSIYRVSSHLKVQITHKGTDTKKDGWDSLSSIISKNTLSPDIPPLYDGTIGISFSKGITELHQGKISLVAENGTHMLTVSLPAGTSHFRMEDIQENEKDTEDIFPLQPLALEEIVDDDPFWQEEVEGAQKKTYRMLLIEDDYEMRKLLKETFSMLYEVIEFDNANEGYKYALKELPDIILSKVNLPGLSGIEMCSMLKSNVNTYHLPVVLLSSQPSYQQNVESIRSGAEYYFVKPLNIRILFLSCNYLVKNRRKIMQNTVNDPTNVFEMATNEKEQEFLEMANRIVEENLLDPSFDTSIWHKKMKIGRTRFFNQIKDITGMTPNDYLVYLKMNKAKRFFDEDKNQTVAEVAYRLGFGTPSYFSKCFKKQFGVTPQEYKRKI